MQKLAIKTKKPIMLSHILIFINVAIFLVMFFYDSSLSSDTLIKFGAKYNFNIAKREYYRLFTAIFLHAGIAHLIFNMVALNAFGKDIEIIFGKVKFITIYIMSGLIASFGSFAMNYSVGVGASGAIFGLLGANLYLLYLNPKAYKKIYGKDIIILIAINIVYGFTNPQIDNSAHLFGLIGGFLVAKAIGVSYEKTFDKKRLPYQILIIIIALIFFKLAIPNYINSWNYDLNKGIECLNNNNLIGAREYLERGKSKKPNIKDFDNLLHFIDEYEHKINNE